jgi:hypothetical protein
VPVLVTPDRLQVLTTSARRAPGTGGQRSKKVGLRFGAESPERIDFGVPEAALNVGLARPEGSTHKICDTRNTPLDHPIRHGQWPMWRWSTVYGLRSVKKGMAGDAGVVSCEQLDACQVLGSK